MKKNILKIAIAITVGIFVFFGVRTLTAPDTEEGAKAILVTVEIEQEDKSYKTIYEETVHTDGLVLSDLLLEMNDKGLLKVELSGNKTDPYGRSLQTMGEYTFTDWNTGPWWLYNSDNNPDCVAAGYCSGVDSCPIYDNDHFVFRYTTSY